MKKLLIAGGVGILVLLISGAVVGMAFADDPGTGKGGIQQTFISKVARILGVQEQQLKDAAKQAQLEMVDDAVKAGKLTQDQSARLKERIEKGGAIWGPPNLKAPKSRAQANEIRNLLNAKALADFLGMKPVDLLRDLRDGKTLAEIGTEHGKTPTEMKDAILSYVKKHVDEAVAKGKLTTDQAATVMEKAGERVDKLLATRFKGKGPLPRGKQGGNPGKS